MEITQGLVWKEAHADLPATHQRRFLPSVTSCPSSPGCQRRLHQLWPLGWQTRSHQLMPPRSLTRILHSAPPVALPLLAKPLRSGGCCYISMATTEIPMHCEVRPAFWGLLTVAHSLPSLKFLSPGDSVVKALPSSPHAPPRPSLLPQLSLAPPSAARSPGSLSVCDLLRPHHSKPSLLPRVPGAGLPWAPVCPHTDARLVPALSFQPAPAPNSPGPLSLSPLFPFEMIGCFRNPSGLRGRPPCSQGPEGFPGGPRDHWPTTSSGNDIGLPSEVDSCSRLPDSPLSPCVLCQPHRLPCNLLCAPVTSHL